MPTFTERVATTDSTQSLESSSDRTILVDRFDEIGATGGRVPTVAAQQGTDANLVDPHAKDHCVSR